MQLLLDSHTLLWATHDPVKLSAQVREAIAADDTFVFVSLASLWELRIKESIGKLEVPKHFYSSLEPAGYELLPVSLDHIQRYGELPLHHRDPFDRMLVAQTQCEDMLLATRDEQIKRYDVGVLDA